MKDNEGKEIPKESGKENAGASFGSPEVTYTPEQEPLLRNGLRIWARVAIRSYLRQQAEWKRAEGDGGGK